MAAKKKPSKSAAPRAARSGAVATFIKSQPADAAPAAVVEAGKAAGLTFSKNYVYKLRAKPKAATARVPKPKARARKRAPRGSMATRAERALAKLSSKGVARTPDRAAPAPSSPSSRVTSSGPERELAALIVQVGTARAEEILNRVRDALSKLAF